MDDDEFLGNSKARGCAESARLYRIASVSELAEKVLEDRNAADQWMSKPNQALGNRVPILLCETEIGAKHVRRVLHALESGGVA